MNSIFLDLFFCNRIFIFIILKLPRLHTECCETKFHYYEALSFLQQLNTKYNDKQNRMLHNPLSETTFGEVVGNLSYIFLN